MCVSVRGARRHARRSRRTAAAHCRSSSSRSRRLEARGDCRAALNPIYKSTSSKPLRDHGIQTIVTLTRFYQRVKNIHGSAACAASSRPTSKSIFRRCCGCCFTLLRETREGDRIALQPGDHDFAHCSSSIVAASRPRRRQPPAIGGLLMSAEPPARRKGCSALTARTSPRECRSRHGTRPRYAAPQMWCFYRCRCFTSTPTSASSRCRS